MVFVKNKKLKLSDPLLKTKEKGIVEDATEYGEFIATFDAWLTPEEQRRRARYMEELENEDEE